MKRYALSMVRRLCALLSLARGSPLTPEFLTGLTHALTALVDPACKQAGRADTTHFLSECSFLPNQDRKYIAKARQIADITDHPMEREATSSVDEPYSDSHENTPVSNTKVCRIQTAVILKNGSCGPTTSIPPSVIPRQPKTR